MENNYLADCNKNDIVPCDAPVNSSNSIEQGGGYYYDLFKFFSDEHGLTLVDSEIQDIIRAVEKFNNDPVRKIINEDKPLYTELFLGTEGNTMTINAFDDDHELSIVIRDNGRKSIYSMNVWEVGKVVEYLSEHHKNELLNE
jgi:hypothetical protein